METCCCAGLAEPGLFASESEVLKLAAESLKLFADEFVLEISHLDILSSFVDGIAPDAATREAILHCAGEKNLHGIRCICRENGIAEGAEEPLIQLLSLYGTPKIVMPTIRALAEENGVGEAAGAVAAGDRGVGAGEVADTPVVP